jgi:LysM repeat protein
MVRRLLARLLALLALLAVAAGVYVILHTTVLKPHSTTTGSSTVTRTTGGRHHHKAKPKFYVVKQGDTLSAIASKTGVALSRLTTLNPSVSSPPYSLQTGQRLRLRR